MRQLISSVCLASVFAAIVAVPASADVIFTDDFESTQNTQRWQVYQDISDGAWTVTQGSGVEIQDSVVVGAHSGRQYLELDSSFSRGGVRGSGGTNSAITRNLNGLSAGEYVLEYYYQARTNRADDNTISVYADAAGENLFSNLLDTANGVGADGWVHRSASFSVAADDSSLALSFRAEGIENALGGFIDSVRLQRVGSVPAPAGLGFILLGLAGIGAAARRRRG